MTLRNLDVLFRPSSVAVLGASDRPGSLGAVVLDKLMTAGFAGPIWPVNPRHGQIRGGPAWPSVAALPAAPDLAVICTPAVTVPGLIAELGQRGTRSAIVITAGLKQVMPGQAITLEQAMLEAARPHLLRILGPNCLGALVPGMGLNASFAPAQGLKGPLAFVTQSGALATAMLDWANERGIGFSHFVSLGDSADVDFGDMLDFLATDPDTRAILLYIESVKHARKFMSAARAAARNKPVILVKAGRAPEGARAAASHTGALAGSDKVFDAAVQRAGLLRVHTLEALFDAAETLAHLRGGWRQHVGSQAGRLVILTNGGGAGVLAADALALAGGQLAQLQAPTLAALDACLPDTWSRGNPVDIIGDAPVERYLAALRVLLAAPEVDGLLFMHAPTAIVPASEIAAACLPVLQSAAKPVLLSWLGGTVVACARRATRQAGLPSHDTPERAVDAWMQMVRYQRHQEALGQLVPAGQGASPPDRQRVQQLLQQARAQGLAWLGDAATQQLLAAYGVPTVATQRTADLPEALAAAERIGYPVALKIISPQVVHKTDVGGVALNLQTPQALRQAAERMQHDLARLAPQAELAGLTVQAMAVRPGAHELILGLSTDPVFGPVLLLGEGGVTVELRSQHAVALPPLNQDLADDLIERSGLAPLLAGYRGRPAADLQALRETLLKLSELAADLPDIVELDINPLLVDEQGVLALDARARLRPSDQPPARLAIRPYPAELEQTQVLGDGQVLLRPIRPEDGERLARFYATASPADMRLRFFTVRREVPHSELARYSQIDYDREMTFIALPADAPHGDMLGEARALCDPDNVRAEFAIQVAGKHQGKGLGRLLLQTLIAYLKTRGTAELVGQCLPENLRLQALARSLGFDVTSVPGTEGVLQLRLGLRA